MGAKAPDETPESDRRRALVEKAAAERDADRIAREQAMLKELEDAKKKKEQIEAKRKSNLGGAFALTEEDMNADEDAAVQKARAAKEMARAEERRAARERHRESLAGEAVVSSS